MLKCKNVSLITLQSLRKILDVVFLSTQWTAVVVVAVDVSSTHNAYAYSLATNVQGKWFLVFSPNPAAGVLMAHNLLRRFVVVYDTP